MKQFLKDFFSPHTNINYSTNQSNPIQIIQTTYPSHYDTTIKKGPRDAGSVQNVAGYK